MKPMTLCAIVLVSLGVCGSAQAQTKAERCAAYARDAVRNSPTTTGPGRGAARGAAGAAVFGGDAGKGAAVGALTGGARRAAQRGRSEKSYYDECMRR